MSVVSKSSLKVLVVVLIVGILFAATGCSLVDRILSFRDSDDDVQLDNAVFEPPEEPTITPEVEYLGETTDITLFFADPSGEGLATETRSVQKVEGIARATITELIKGPMQSGLLPTIPEGTQLKDINVKDNGLMIVDFSSDLIENHLGGSTEESLTVYSIVNTLSQFSTVDEVQILVDGQYVDSIAGHVDVSQAMAPNTDLIIK